MPTGPHRLAVIIEIRKIAPRAGRERVQIRLPKVTAHATCDARKVIATAMDLWITRWYGSSHIPTAQQRLFPHEIRWSTLILPAPGHTAAGFVDHHHVAIVGMPVDPTVVSHRGRLVGLKVERAKHTLYVRLARRRCNMADRPHPEHGQRLHLGRIPLHAPASCVSLSFLAFLVLDRCYQPGPGSGRMLPRYLDQRFSRDA